MYVYILEMLPRIYKKVRNSVKNGFLWGWGEMHARLLLLGKGEKELSALGTQCKMTG